MDREKIARELLKIAKELKAMDSKINVTIWMDEDDMMITFRVDDDEETAPASEDGLKYFKREADKLIKNLQRNLSKLLEKASRIQ